MRPDAASAETSGRMRLVYAAESGEAERRELACKLPEVERWPPECRPTCVTTTTAFNLCESVCTWTTQPVSKPNKG